jgi:hypothetical protein
MNFLTTYTSFENYLFKPFAHLLIELLILLEFICLGSPYTLVINSLSDEYLAKIFYNSVNYLFILVTISFAVPKLLVDVIPFFNPFSYLLNC